MKEDICRDRACIFSNIKERIPFATKAYPLDTLRRKGDLRRRDLEKDAADGMSL